MTPPIHRLAKILVRNHSVILKEGTPVDILLSSKSHEEHFSTSKILGKFSEKEHRVNSSALQLGSWDGSLWCKQMLLLLPVYQDSKSIQINFASFPMSICDLNAPWSSTVVYKCRNEERFLTVHKKCFIIP